jgi:hypothetical protein
VALYDAAGRGLKAEAGNDFFLDGGEAYRLGSQCRLAGRMSSGSGSSSGKAGAVRLWLLLWLRGAGAVSATLCTIVLHALAMGGGYVLGA